MNKEIRPPKHPCPTNALRAGSSVMSSASPSVCAGALQDAEQCTDSVLLTSDAQEHSREQALNERNEVHLHGLHMKRKESG